MSTRKRGRVRKKMGDTQGKLDEGDNKECSKRANDKNEFETRNTRNRMRWRQDYL